jgi:hypothetical protein
MLVALAEILEQHVDPDVLAVPERIGHAEHADRHHQVPLELLHPDRADREAVTQEDVRAHDQGQAQREPSGGTADEINEGVDPAGKLER